MLNAIWIIALLLVTSQVVGLTRGIGAAVLPRVALMLSVRPMAIEAPARRHRIVRAGPADPGLPHPA